MDGDALVAGLNASQLEAVTTDGEPVVVLAGAGSGKTRVLTRRIAYRIATGETDPNRVMALTFTRKAAGELRQRLRAVGLRDAVAAGTFHSLALLQLRQRWAERHVSPPALLDRKIRFVARLLGSNKGRKNSVDAIDVVTELDWARARLVGPDDYPMAAREAGRTPPLPAEQIGEILDRYQQEKRRRRLVDFDDLLMLAIRDLRSDERYAAAIRWRYRHLYVDEMQDVNPLQYELLSEWRGGRDDLFIVGDPNQAIYGWNGADPNLLRRFVSREPNATVVELADNYRSTPQILRTAGSLIAGSELAPNRADGPVPTITAYADDRAEADGIATAVRDAHSVAGDWSDQAVLVRTNAQLTIIEQALADAGIATRLRGTTGPLASPELRTELALLTKPDADLHASLLDLEARVAERPQVETVAAIERRANLAALVRLVNDYVMSDPTPNGPGLAAWIGTLEKGDTDVDTDAVELATFHAAKGLEWPVVHVAGLEEGFVPIAYASTGAQLAEEKRLLYVAVTRAMDELHLSWAAERTFTSKPVTRSASPHLGLLADRIERLGVGPKHRVDWQAQLANSREALRRATAPIEARAAGAANRDTADGFDDLYERLRQWRTHKARAADVPAHAVFTDQTLRAIATARPTSTGQLAAVPGVGAAKLQRHGDELLRVLTQSGSGGGNVRSAAGRA
ncbi:MAG: UvrD-helicase domain-containing protein [Acidimicrobiales bacterium]